MLLLLASLACAPDPGPAPLPSPVSAKIDADGDGEDGATDCDDANAAVYAGATESCNATDDDCDGEIDESGCACAVATYGEHVYQLCTTPLSWTSAQADCAGHGYHLADLDDADENAWVWGEAEAAASASAWWFGLHDRDTEGDYTWDGGSDAPYTNWRRGEPNDYGGNEDCVAWVDDSAGLWNDKVCASAYPYVCEAGCATASWWPDLDGDGHGDANGALVRACEAPADTAADATDCDDGDAAVAPDAPETCDGLDDDCDGLTDDANPDVNLGTAGAHYADADGDGYGTGAATLACTPPADTATADGDCDDTDATVSPGATDTPGDGLDQDCSGADSCRYYLDLDGDGHGDPATGSEDCAPPTGWVALGDDCDDTNPDVAPGLPEVWYDGVDQDCDGLDDDQDGDGDPAATDCDDLDPDRASTLPEACNALDDDCDGLVDDGGCPCTTVEDGNRTYLFCTDLASWDEAAATCAGYGYTLVDVEDADENLWLWVEAEALNPTSNWSIGLSDQASEGRYDWDSGSSSTYTNWRSGEPNDYGGAEDCIAWPSGGGGYWNDKSCASSYPYVCELGCLATDAYPDADGDGHGDASASPTRSCTPPPGTTSTADDCDDTDAAVFPGAAEVCNTRDDDCDGLLNDADPDADLSTATDWFPDLDGDGYGDGAATFACDPPAATAALDGDCDDADPAISPGAVDLAGDGLDQDCDGADDCLYYRDADGDGYGDPAASDPTCTPAADQVALGTDCDDGDPSLSPGNAEIWYDGIDQDCDGIDDDQDGDGDPVATDCDDTDPARSTLASEACNAEDDDCDGALDEEGCPCATVEEDGHVYQLCTDAVGWAEAEAACVATGYHLADVDDAAENARIWTAAELADPGASWWMGLSDTTTEGTYAWTSGSGSTYTNWRAGEPNDYGGNEDCAAWADDGLGQWNDKDCAGEHAYVCEAGCVSTAWSADVDGDGAGSQSGALSWACTAPAGTGPATDCDDADATVSPDATEVCDGADNDCDGLLDEADPDVDLATALAWYADLDGDGVGGGVGTLACTPPAGDVSAGGDCDDADATVYPGALDLSGDGIDQDCDGADDCRYYTDADGDGWGDPATLVETCTPGAGQVGLGDDCDDANPAVSPGASEVWYDGVDQDCDGADDDRDGDGDPVATDCDDLDPLRSSVALELCDGRDNDCDLALDEDVCPVAAWPYGDHVYLFVDGAFSWADAQAACAALSYHLVDLADSAENSAVFAQALVTNPSGTWWMGLNDRETEGSFAWDGGSTSTYTNWKLGEPNDYNENEDCGAWVPDGLGAWNDKDCAGTFGYVCEAGCEAVDWYEDADGDGWGGATLSHACGAPEGGITVGGDCDDGAADVHPGADEPADGIDHDCDGDLAAPDTDGDGASDEDEAIWGTDPTDPDSDDDTLLDGEEANANHDGDALIDALDDDDDGDGIPTADEATVDVDGDGVADTDLDGDAVVNWLDDDADGDRIDDAEEGDGDCDADGLADWADTDACAGDSAEVEVPDDSASATPTGKTGDTGCGCGDGSAASALGFAGMILLGRRRRAR